MKAIKSTDPRKPLIVAALCKASGGTRVTNVRETDDRYVGDCMSRQCRLDGKHPGMYWAKLGAYSIEKGFINLADAFTYTVTKWCHHAGVGRCTQCEAHGGKRMRVVAYSGPRKDMAERILRNWAAYGTELVVEAAHL